MKLILLLSLFAIASATEASLEPFVRIKGTVDWHVATLEVDGVQYIVIDNNGHVVAICPKSNITITSVVTAPPPKKIEGDGKQRTVTFGSIPDGWKMEFTDANGQHHIVKE